RERDAIVKITKKLKIAAIDDLTSFANLAAEFGVDPKEPSAQEKWFTPAEGLQWVAAVRGYVEAQPESVAKPERVIADLDQYTEVLTKAQGINAKWHFCIDI